MPTRRRFLQWAGAGAAASLAAGQSFAAETATSGSPTPKASVGKRTFELGLASYSVHKFPLDQALAMAKCVGLKHICLNPIHVPVESKPAQIADALAKVRAAGLDWYGSGVVDMREPKQIQQAFEFAKAAGLKVLVSLPSPDVLPLVSEKVKQYDIRVAIHNHGPGDPLFPTPDIAYAKIKSLDPRVGLCIDIGHTLRNGVDPSAAAEQFADRLFDVHLKDINVAAADGHGVEVGRGVLDIPKFLRTLDKIHYSGMASFEYEKAPDDPLAGLAESVGYVRGVLAVI
jgi:sugar phosphate isomerase/epimerase